MNVFDIYGVSNYDNGRRKDVVNKYLEFVTDVVTGDETFINFDGTPS